MIQTFSPRPALARAEPTTSILIQVNGTQLFFSVTVAEIVAELLAGLPDLEPGDLERIAALARAARERQNDCSELPLFEMER